MILINALTLSRDNLILRGPQARDIELVITFLQYGTRAEIIGHFPQRGDACHWFAALVGHWHIHGYSYFTNEKKSGEIAGITGIWCPETCHKAEVDDVIFSAFEGQRIAYEAASRARRWAYKDLGFTTLTSNIAPDNSRSQRLAKRMGAFYEKSYKNTYENEDIMPYRHPGPESFL